MKRVGNLYQQIYAEDNLKSAFIKAQKGKKNRLDVKKFCKDIDYNISNIQQDFINHNLNLGDYEYFYVREPKVRRICKSSFEERIVHHAIINICGKYIDKNMIFDSYACIKNKGTHKALEKTLKNTRYNSWYLKLDIRKYFNSINHKILMSLYSKMFKDKELLELFWQILNSYHFHKGYGLPLGGLFSQYSANLYLSLLDHFVKEELQCKYYVRYMDDFIIWDKSFVILNNYLVKIESFLKDKLDLTLKNDIQINKVEHGIPFLGYRVFPKGFKLKKEGLKRLKRKFSKAEKNYIENKISERDLITKVQSLFAFISYGTKKSFRNCIIDKYSVYY